MTISGSPSLVSAGNFAGALLVSDVQDAHRRRLQSPQSPPPGHLPLVAALEVTKHVMSLAVAASDGWRSGRAPAEIVNICASLAARHSQPLTSSADLSHRASKSDPSQTRYSPAKSRKVSKLRSTDRSSTARTPCRSARTRRQAHNCLLHRVGACNEAIRAASISSGPQWSSRRSVPTRQVPRLIDPRRNLPRPLPFRSGQRGDGPVAEEVVVEISQPHKGHLNSACNLAAREQSRAARAARHWSGMRRGSDRAGPAARPAPAKRRQRPDAGGSVTAVDSQLGSCAPAASARFSTAVRQSCPRPLSASFSAL